MTLNYDRVATFSLEAYVEVSLKGAPDVHAVLTEMIRKLGEPREIRDAITLMGDVDALLRVRVATSSSCATS